MLNIDEAEILHLGEIGWTTVALAERYRCSRSTIRRIFQRNDVYRRNAPIPKVASETLIGFYEEGFGCTVIGRMVGLHPGSVLQRLHSVGAVDQSRQKRASGLPRRARRRREQEFSSATKRRRFREEQGICQECRNPIISWMEASYHHIVMCRAGGTSDPANCMVLHRACHNDPVVFRRLHGGSEYHLIQRNYGDAMPYVPRVRKQKTVKLPRLSRVRNEDVRSLHAEGVSLRQISRRLNVSHITVRNRLKQICG